MPITIKCPDCGHTEESKSGAEKSCPECEGTMAPPAKKKYQAKTQSLEEEERAKKKKGRADDDDADEKPKAKKKKSFDDEEKGEGFALDAAPAEALELNTGFKNKKLMKQVQEELSRGETLFWAGRMCPEIVDKKAFWARVFGLIFAGAGGVFCAIFFAVAPWFVGLVPILFIAIGVAIAIVGPTAMRNQGARTWYAVTNQRAIVFTANMFGESGGTESYEPNELRRMRVKSAKSPKGAGDLIFKTKVTEQRTDYVDRKTGRTVRSETSRTETYYGFLGIEDVREVETLVHKVLLKTIDDDEDDDDRPRKGKSSDDDDGDEPKAKKKSRDDDDDEDEQPRPKKKRPRDDDDD